jgi:hypothetical protein
MAFRRRARRGDEEPAQVAVGASGRPLVTITDLDGVPSDLAELAPLDGELLRVIPGADRPDYCLVVLDQPRHVHVGANPVWIRAVVVVARLAGEQVTPGARNLAVDLALVLDDTTLGDDALDFAKVLPVGTATFHRRAAPPSPPPPPALTTQDVYAIYVRLAQTLRDDLEDERGGPIDRLDLSVELDAQLRITSLTASADGLAVRGEPAMLDRANTVAGELSPLAPRHRPRRLDIHVDGTRVSFEVGGRQP